MFITKCHNNHPMALGMFRSDNSGSLLKYFNFLSIIFLNCGPFLLVWCMGTVVAEVFQRRLEDTGRWFSVRSVWFCMLACRGRGQGAGSLGNVSSRVSVPEANP